MSAETSHRFRPDDLFRRQVVRELMRCWHKPAAMERHPFIQLEVVKALRDRHGLDQTEALRQVVREAVAATWPDDVHNPRARRKRQIIESHYWQGVPLKHLAQAMRLDERWMRRILGEALDELACGLRKLEARTQARAVTTPPAIQMMPSLAVHPLLIGREQILTWLIETLQPDGRVVGISGLPGSGKTALMTHATRHSDTQQRFPDGVLWADLSQRVSPASMLYQWGIVLGLSEADLRRVSGDASLLAAMIRSILEDHRCLIVLNNITSLDNARQLLLGGPSCCHLVASPFSNIAAHLAPVHCISLPPLTPEASRQLIEALAPGVSHLDAKMLNEVIAWCDGLPLALTAVGRYLAQALRSGQQRRAEIALRRLREAYSRIIMLADPAASPLNLLSVAIQASIAQIPPARRHALHRLAALPPRPATFDESTMLAILDGDIASLESLVDAGLVECSGDSYSLHPVICDVLRADITMRSSQRDGQLALARAAQAMLATKTPRMNQYSANERTLLLAAAQAAVQLGAPEVARDLAVNAADVLDAWGELRLLESLLTTAQSAKADACRAVWLHAKHAQTLSRLGQIPAAHHEARAGVAIAEKDCPDALPLALCAQATVHANVGETGEALALSERALAHGICDDQLRLKALYIHGAALHNSGHYDAARADFLQALALAEALGAVREEVWLVWALGSVAQQQQNYDEAERWLKRTLDRARSIAMHEHIALALIGLGVLAKERGQYEEAERCFAEAEDPARRIALPWPLVQLRHAQGALYLQTGRLTQAEQALREALCMAEANVWRTSAASVSVELGECLLAQGRANDAEQVCLFALTQAQACTLDDLAALLRYVLSRVKHAQGDLHTAQRLAEAACQQVTHSGHYRAAEIVAWTKQLQEQHNKNELQVTQ